MVEILFSGGWLMIPILICSVLSVAISLERAITLRAKNVTPKELMSSVALWIESDQLGKERLLDIRNASPLGAIIVAGLSSASLSRERMQESIQEAAGQVIHELERNLTALGTIASVAPLLGLLGTVLGMIKVFAAIMLEGSGNASVLAGGISEALITTAAGMFVAIPTLVFHRYFHRKIDSLVIEMEQEAVKLVDSMHGDTANQSQSQVQAPVSNKMTLSQNPSVPNNASAAHSVLSSSSAHLLDSTALNTHASSQTTVDEAVVAPDIELEPAAVATKNDLQREQPLASRSVDDDLEEDEQVK